MNKILLSSFVIASFTTYAVYENFSHAPADVYNKQQNQNVAINDSLNQIKSFQNNSDDIGFEVSPSQNNTQIVNNPTPTNTTPTPKSTPAPIPTPAPAPKPKGLYTDGTYTGDQVDVNYGIVQVQAVISGGKLTDVVFLSYPNDRPESLRKSNRAMPILIQEAIQAQSAQVDAATGASYTSAGFTQSLTSALTQAKA